MPATRKRTTKRLYTLSLLTGIAVAGAAGLVLFVSVSRGGVQDNMKGWAWNAFRSPYGITTGLGWTSFNCVNDFDNDAVDEYQCDSVAGINYGLHLSTGGALDGADDYLQGCGWSALYGWVCFNGGFGGEYQCDSSQSSACNPLGESGNGIQSYGGFFHHLVSPYYYPLNKQWYLFGYVETLSPPWDTPSLYFGYILSQYDASNEYKGMVVYPFSDDPTRDPNNVTQYVGTLESPLSPDLLHGCINCEESSGTCGACLNVNPAEEDAVLNPNPNVLCWDCSGCTITEEPGSCVVNKDANTCPASQCSQCTDFPGVLINERIQDSGAFEMCGIGYNGYSLDFGACDPASWWDCDWAYRRKLTFRNAGGETLTDFPVLVQLDPSNFDLFFFPDGADFRFIDADDSTVLDYEIERWDTDTGYAWVWVNVPSIAATDSDYIWMYYGNPSATSASVPENVWNSGYVGVWHLGEDAVDEASVPYLHPDSTGHSNDGSQFGNNNVTGIIGQSQNFDPGEYVYVQYEPSVAPASEFMLSAWIRLDGPGSNGAPFFSKVLGTAWNFGLLIDDGDYGCAPGEFAFYSDADPAELVYERCSGEFVTNDGEWHHMVYSQDGADWEMYVDGVLAANGDNAFPLSPGPTAPGALYFGDDTYLPFDGQIDEVRMSTVARSSGWIDAEYKSQANQFIIYGQEDYPGVDVRGLGWIVMGHEKWINDPAYIDVAEGSIASGGSIVSPATPPAGRYNAAYLIEASGDIVNWHSAGGLLYPNEQRVPPFLSSESATGRYRNVLGTLDLAGLITDVPSGVAGSGVNKYGRAINSFEPSSTLNTALNDEVYYFSPADCTADGGALTVLGGEPRFVKPGSGSESGAGIIVVDCDLHFVRPSPPLPPEPYRFAYDDATAPTSLRNIGSVVWVVRGDVVIDPVITELPGAFIVLGEDGAPECPEIDSGALSDGCGRFSTGESAYQLSINGSVMARQFNFERSYSDNEEPAEYFVPDGRLQANPPSGLRDFARSSPRFSSGN